MADQLPLWPRHGWVCFHCGEKFAPCMAGREAAREHFGATVLADPACRIDVAEYRRMEEVNRRHCEEDTDLHRALHAKDAEMRRAVQFAEEVGYARGLRAGMAMETADG